MSRSRALLAPIAVVAASIVLGPGAALSQADAADASQSSGGAVDDDPYAFDDEEDYDYVDIDSYGTETDEPATETADGARGTATSDTATTGTAVADPVAETADVSESRSLADHAVRAGEITMDLLILRPFGAAATGVGCGFLLAGSPFLIVSDDYDTARDVFVDERARYTFKRPLGRL